MILAVLTAVVFLGALSVLQSCSKNEEMPSSLEKGENTSNISWNEQLNLSLHNGKSIIKSSSMTKESNLKLVCYKILKSITNSSDVDDVKTELLSSTSVFPYLDLERNKLILLTSSEISQQKQYEGVDYSIARLSKFLDEKINVGLKEIELTWECDSKRYTSICLASDEKGIIYDNIISNLINFQVSNNEENKKGVSKAKRFKTTAESIYTGTRTWGETATVDWLWGSQRGESTISHSLYIVNGSVWNSSYTADSYMSIGNCEAQGKIVELKLGGGGFSKLAYAYAMSTPFMTISISYSELGYSVSVSGVLGSEMHNSGTNILDNN